MFSIKFGEPHSSLPLVVSPVANYVATDPAANVAAFAVNGTINGLNQALKKINSTLSSAYSVKRELDYEIGRNPLAANAFKSMFDNICAQGLQEVNEYNNLRSQTLRALVDACATLSVPPPTHGGTPEVKIVYCLK